MYLSTVPKITSLLDRIKQNLKYTTCTCCAISARSFSHMLFDIERELFLIKKSEENKVVSSMGRHPGLSINDRNILLGLLETGMHAADVAGHFGRNKRTIYRLQACFSQTGSTKDRPHSGRP